MRGMLAAAALSAVAATALADPIAPTDVVFDGGAVGQSLTGAPGNAEAGPAVMDRDAGNCVACHQVSALPGLAFQGDVGPSLDGVGSRWTEAELRGIVANAKMTFDGTIMPSFYKTTGYTRPGVAFTGKAPDGELPPILTAQQVEDVVAFLATMKDQ